MVFGTDGFINYCDGPKLVRLPMLGLKARPTRLWPMDEWI